MPETITTQDLLQKIQQKTIPIVMITAGVALLSLAAVAVVNSNHLPQPPKLTEGKYVPAQVVFKVKPGKNPQQVLADALQAKQEVYRDSKTGKIISKFSPEVKKNPKQFQKESLQLHQKELRQLFPKVKISDEVREKILRRNGAKDPDTSYDELGMDRWYIAEVQEQQTDVAQFVQHLQADRGNVETAEANSVAKPDSESNQPIDIADTGGGGGETPPRLGVSETTTSSNPNDPYFYSSGHANSSQPDLQDQWGLFSGQVPGAWATSSGDLNTIIGIVDTGIDYNHPDIQQKIWINAPEDINSNGCADYWGSQNSQRADAPSAQRTDCHGSVVWGDLDGVDNDGNSFIDDVNGMDFYDIPLMGVVNDPIGPLDDNGHGTHVAGIAAATTNNATTDTIGNPPGGVAGVCWSCQVMPVRILGMSGGGSIERTVRGINYAAANGADIINMSFGSNDNALLRQTIQYAKDFGIILIGAAGNWNLLGGEQEGNADTNFPGAYPEVISVGNLFFSGYVSDSSSFGETVDIVAPGVGIVSLRAHFPIRGMPLPFGFTINNDYTQTYGTSMASPFVSGVAGLMLSVNPSLGQADVQEILETTATDLINPRNPVLGDTNPYPGHDRYSGWGQINAEAAVEEAKRRIPDVAVEALGNQVTVGPGNILLVRIDIVNRTWYHARQVRYRLRDANTNTILLEDVIDDMFPNGVSWINRDIRLAGNPIPSSVYIDVDPNNELLETNENNNQILFPVVPYGTPAFQSINNVEINPGQQRQFTISATDPDGQTLSYQARRLPTSSTYANRQFTWVPFSNQLGRYRKIFITTDTNNLTDNLPVTTTVVEPNDPYQVVLNPIGDKEIRSGRTLTFSVAAISANRTPGFLANLDVSGLPAGATFNTTTGIFSWTPTAGQQGAYIITFRSFNNIRSFVEPIEITVVPNRPPVFLSSVGNVSVNEGGQVSFVLNASDLDSDPLTYSYTILSQPAGTTFDAALNAGTGVFTWNPTYSASGVYTVRLMASDGVASVTQDSQITVADVVAPKYNTLMSNRVFIDSPLFRVNEGFYASNTNPYIPGACVNAENRCKADWAPLNFTSANIQKSDIQFIRIKMNTFSGWSAALQNTCLASPGLPACSVVGTSGSGVYTFDLYNNANLFFMEQDEYGNKFGTAGFTGGGAGPDWNTWMGLCAQSYSSRQGGVAINTTPFSDVFGTSSLNRLELCLVDHYNETSLRSAWTVEVHRKSMNVSPILSPLLPTYSVMETSPLTIQPTATDYNEDRLWYSASPLPAGASINQFTGAFTWTPNLTQVGVYPVVFTVSDKHLSSSWATAITVTRFNTAPVFYQPTTQKAIRGDDFYFPFHATDAQNDPLTYSIVSAPAGSTIDAVIGIFRWHVPTVYPLGLTQLVIRASDGYGGTATVTLAFDVVLPRNGGGGGGDLCNEDGLGGKYCRNPFVIE